MDGIFTIQTEGAICVLRVDDAVAMTSIVFHQAVRAVIAREDAKSLRVMVSQYSRFNPMGIKVLQSRDDANSLLEATSITNFVMVAKSYSSEALFADLMRKVVAKIGIAVYHEETLEKALARARELIS